MKDKKRDSRNSGQTVPSADSEPPDHMDDKAAVCHLLPQLMDRFREVVAIYNQAAGQKVKVHCSAKQAERSQFEVTIDQNGVRFIDSGEGFIRVLQISDGFSREWSRVEPQLDPSGGIIGWQERASHIQGRMRTQTVEGLTDAYLMHVVRRRLLG